MITPGNALSILRASYGSFFGTARRDRSLWTILADATKDGHGPSEERGDARGIDVPEGAGLDRAAVLEAAEDILEPARQEIETERGKTLETLGAIRTKALFAGRGFFFVFCGWALFMPGIAPIEIFQGLFFFPPATAVFMWILEYGPRKAYTSLVKARLHGPIIEAAGPNIAYDPDGQIAPEALDRSIIYPMHLEQVGEDHLSARYGTVSYELQDGVVKRRKGKRSKTVFRGPVVRIDLSRTSHPEVRPVICRSDSLELDELNLDPGKASDSGAFRDRGDGDPGTITWAKEYFDWLGIGSRSVATRIPRPLAGSRSLSESIGISPASNGVYRVSLDHVTLESRAFNDRFEVLAADQVEARVILTPALMARLLDLGQIFGSRNLAVSFHGKEVFVMIDTRRDLFHVPQVEQETDPVGDLNLFLSEVAEIHRLIDTIAERHDWRESRPDHVTYQG